MDNNEMILYIKNKLVLPVFSINYYKKYLKKFIDKKLYAETKTSDHTVGSKTITLLMVD